jgi:hypothetical protein
LKPNFITLCKKGIGKIIATDKIWHVIPYMQGVLKFVRNMKTVLQRLGVTKDAPLEKFRTATAILMILFFLTFGAASLMILINSAA